MIKATDNSFNSRGSSESLLKRTWNRAQSRGNIDSFWQFCTLESVQTFPDWNVLKIFGYQIGMGEQLNVTETERFLNCCVFSIWILGCDALIFLALVEFSSPKIVFCQRDTPKINEILQMGSGVFPFRRAELISKLELLIEFRLNWSKPLRLRFFYMLLKFQ